MRVLSMYSFAIGRMTHSGLLEILTLRDSSHNQVVKTYNLYRSRMIKGEFYGV